MHKSTKKICIVSSCGGHLTEIRTLLPIYSEYEHFYVLNHKAILASDMHNKTYYITHSERDWKFFINLYESFRIIKKEKPDIILSAGAGLIVPFSLIAKYLFGIKTIYIETIASTEKPSLSGKLMYPIADYFYYQWPDLSKFFPKGQYIGTLL